MITIMRREVYLEVEHIQLIKDEEEYVKQRYFAVARTLAEPINITRKEAAEMLGLSVRQVKRFMKKFKKGINGLKKKSTRPTPNRIPEDIEKGNGIWSKQDSDNCQALKIENRKPVSNTTCYNMLARNGLVEAERRIQTQ